MHLAHPSRPALLRPFVVLFALATALALVAAPVAAQQEDPVTPARVAGETRFETAAAIATLTFDEAEAAIVVTGQDFPDALAASYAAGSAGVPILLVAQNQVPQSTFEALEELGVEDVVLLGGTGAIGSVVEAAFDDAGYGTVRLPGATRYETAAMVAHTYADLAGIGELEGLRTVFLASGEAFPDALSVGPLAASANIPLLLTPRTHTVDAVNEFVEGWNIERIIVVGGTGAVDSAVVEHYQGLGYEVERFAGATRTETAAVVAQNAIERFEGFDPSLLLLARGDDYPDALAASIHGARNGAAILLTANPTVLSPSTEGYLFDLCPAVDAIRALGGTAAVSEQALSEAVLAAGQCVDDQPGDPTQSYIISPQELISGAPGHEQEFFLIGDEEAVAGATELALFPCDVATFAAGGEVFFADADGDGFADGAGTSDTGAAWISQINDVPQSEDQTRDRAVTGVDYSWHVASAAPDCTVPVIWAGGPHGPELPVDAEGAPLVPFGAGATEWVEDDDG